MKPIQRGVAQAVDAADHRGVAQTGCDVARGMRESLGAGRAGGGNCGGRALQLETRPREVGRRKNVLLMLDAHAVRQRRLRSGSRAIAELGFENSTGAGADEDPDAMRSVSPPRGSDGRGKFVRAEGHLRKPVIAAVEASESAAHRKILDAGHSPDPRRQRVYREIVRSQSAALASQRSEALRTAAAQSVNAGEMSNGERLHRK